MMRSVVPSGFECTAHPVFASFVPPSDSEASEASEACTSESPVCPICLHAFAEPVTLVKCAHSFCSRCIRRWYRIKSECPVCKADGTAYVRENCVSSGPAAVPTYLVCDAALPAERSESRRRSASFEVDAAIASHRARFRRRVA